VSMIQRLEEVAVKMTLNFSTFTRESFGFPPTGSHGDNENSLGA
jgi:hypothetical protein